MAQQRIYTEEQVKDAVKSALDGFGIGQTEDTIDVVVSKLTPIELPSDEEINDEFNVGWSDYQNGCNYGAKWMRDKILNK